MDDGARCSSLSNTSSMSINWPNSESKEGGKTEEGSERGATHVGEGSPF